MKNPTKKLMIDIILGNVKTIPGEILHLSGLRKKGKKIKVSFTGFDKLPLYTENTFKALTKKDGKNRH